MSNILIATYAKRNFGTCLAEAAKEPVIVQKYGRSSMVMASYEAFQRLNASEDALWLQHAQEAADGGYLTPEESDDFLRARLQRAEAGISRVTDT